MIAEFKNLNEEEIHLIEMVPALVSILIAGADDKIDKAEIREANTLAQLKQNKARPELLGYYNEVAPKFETTLAKLLQELPSEPEARSEKVVSTLTQVNSVLEKVDAQWTVKFVDSMRDFAKKVAEAAGGVFGYLSIGYEESKLIQLPMLKQPSLE